MNDLEYIASRTTEEAALRQIAEEAAELAQAALKLCRVIKKDSPTPINVEQAIKNLLEEIGDVQLTLNVWVGKYSSFSKATVVENIEQVVSYKSKRWADRLKAEENKPKEGEENAEEDKQQSKGCTL